MWGTVGLPPVDHLVFYAAIVGFAAVGLIEWPVALVVGVGKVLGDNRSRKTLQSVGEAMELAG